MRPRKSLSQVFLKDRNVIEKIVSCLPLDNSKTLLEIGPGKGQMTFYLVDKVKSLYCVELDPVLSKYLEDNLKDRSNVEIINGDILEFDFSQQYKETGDKLFVFGNIPYSISTPLVVLLAGNIEFLDNVFLTVQKEVAHKITALPGNKSYGFLAVFLWPFFESKVLFDIGKNSFSPVPEVDSSFVNLKPRKEPLIKDTDSYMKFVRKIFDKRRKKIINVLTGLVGDKKSVSSVLGNLGVSPDLRPEDIEQEKFISLFSRSRIN